MVIRREFLSLHAQAIVSALAKHAQPPVTLFRFVCCLLKVRGAKATGTILGSILVGSQLVLFFSKLVSDGAKALSTSVFESRPCGSQHMLGGFVCDAFMALCAGAVAVRHGVAGRGNGTSSINLRYLLMELAALQDGGVDIQPSR
jgi:hypothetical protein